MGRPATQVPQDARSPMPDAGPGVPAYDPLASLGMGPLPLGLGSPMQNANAGSYTQFPAAEPPAMPPIMEMPAGSSPQPAQPAQPERNLFGMPNLFSGFGAAPSAPAAAPAPAPAAGGSAGSGNLFGNLFGGAGNLFGGTAGQGQAFSSQQPANGVFQ